MSKNTAANKAAAKRSNKAAVVATDAKRNTAETSKANAERTAQPGVISAIMHMLCDARDRKTTVTSADMLGKLSKQFAQRKPSGLQITLRAQLSRLPRERNFGISKTRDSGVVMHYAATATAKRDARKVAAA